MAEARALLERFPQLTSFGWTVLFRWKDGENHYRRDRQAPLIDDRPLSGAGARADSDRAVLDLLERWDSELLGLTDWESTRITRSGIENSPAQQASSGHRAFADLT